MLTMRNPTIHEASAKADAHYRTLKVFNIVVTTLLVVIAALAIVNIAAAVSMFRTEIQDLADIGSIREHFTTQWILTLSATALVIFVFKEWKYGERSLGMIYFLAPLLFFALIPTVTAEIQPNARDKVVELTISRCAPGGLEDGRMVDADKCEVASLDEGGVFLSASNPAENAGEMQPPDSTTAAGGKWTVRGIGSYKVYFLVKQESMEHCSGSVFTNNVDEGSRTTSSCIEHDGTVYSVHPLVTNYISNGWLVVYQQLP